MNLPAGHEDGGTVHTRTTWNASATFAPTPSLTPQYVTHLRAQGLVEIGPENEADGHYIVVGKVVELAEGDAAEPLLFYRSGYRTLD